jgi:ABC-type sugar transport system ATPase subunit
MKDAEAEEVPFLEVRGISKRFGTIQALNGVSLRIGSGEVHGLVGANGAGKSTLIRVLAGLCPPDSGHVFIEGSRVSIRDAEQASALGLNILHQELNLVPKMTVLQNLVLGLTKPTHAGVFIDWRKVQREVAPIAKRLNMRFSLNARADSLTVNEEWLVAIGRALLRKARFIALDEPTASLSDDETQLLFGLIRELAASGVAILYVTHRLQEISDLCDVVTVFRDGRVVCSLPRSEVSQPVLVREIIGRTPESNVGSLQGQVAQREMLLEARHLVRRPAVRDVSFSLHVGEVLGLAGLVGAGRTELVRLIFGADRPESGEIILNGEHLHSLTPHRAVKKGIALVPEERRSQGLVLPGSLTLNLNLASLGKLRLVSGLPLISKDLGRRRADGQVRNLNIKTPSLNIRVGQLSGGNQQKVVFGKWLVCDPRVILLDEPTRGVDVGTRAEMYLIIRRLAAEGRGVVMISSDLGEFAQCCDRVLVMVEGKIVGALAGSEISEDRILNLCYAGVVRAV